MTTPHAFASPPAGSGVLTHALSTDDARTSKMVLAVLFTVYFFSSVDRSIFGILAQPIKEDLLLADWQIGFLTGFAFTAVHLAFGFPMAKVADSGNRVGILSICVAFWSIMTAVSGLATSFFQLTLARMGVGVGEAACLPASHSLISDYFPPDRRTKALAIFGLGFPAGSFLGMIFGGYVVDHWGWRAAFYAVGFPGLLIALLTWKMVKEPQRGRYDASDAATPADTGSRSFAEVGKLLWHSPVLRPMIIGLTLMSIFASPTSSFLSPYLARRFPLSYTQIGFIVGTTMMLGASLSTYFGGVIAQRLGQRDQRWLLWFPALSLGAGAPLYVIALAQSEWQSLAVWMFFGALLNATFLAPCYTVLHNTVPPGGRAKAVVIMGLFMSFIGHSVGPLAAGAANDILAGQLFSGSTARDFVQTCPGGQAARGAPEALDLACRGAMTEATQIVMMVTMGLTVWAAWYLFAAGRHMRRASSAQIVPGTVEDPLSA